MEFSKLTAKAVIIGFLAAVGFFGIQSARTQQKQVRLAVPLKSPRLVVQKQNHKLMLYSGTQIVRTYPVGLGFDAIRDKVREGDGRTPEGNFYITAKNPKSQFILSLTVNYPNAENARRGLRDGLITQQQYNAIVQAVWEHWTPLQTTPLGGKILIHTGGNGSKSDWTLGCIALNENEMRELFHAVPVGTPVRIEH